MKTPSRKQRILNHLLTGRSLTQGEAIVLGYGLRLAARINELKAAGHRIRTVLKYDINGIQYAEYSLVTRRLSA